jgi:hypothetical protein
MAETKKIRFLQRAGDPRSGVIIQPGTVTDFPATWADRYIAQGIAEEVKDAGSTAKPEPAAGAADEKKPKPAPKGKKKHG